MNKKQKGLARSAMAKGFTIIELIVVVAIIAVLAAIVLVNVTAYINKGKNAAIMGNLSTIMTNGAVYIDSSTTGYDSFCTNAAVTAPAAAIVGAGGAVTKVCTTAAWCVCSTTKVTSAEVTNTTFCVDSTGYKKATANTGLCATRCPAAGGCVD